MNKQFWINLPVKDLEKSKAFFKKLGFKFSTGQGNTENSACMLLGEKDVVVMLFSEQVFKSFTNNGLADTQHVNEVLLSIDAQSKEEVDEMAALAVAEGGCSNHKPSEMKGGMYGCVFRDLDGHAWNVLWM